MKKEEKEVTAVLYFYSPTKFGRSFCEKNENEIFFCIEDVGGMMKATATATTGRETCWCATEFRPERRRCSTPVTPHPLPILSQSEVIRKTKGSTERLEEV